jgi:hypothetical protein
LPAQKVLAHKPQLVRRHFEQLAGIPRASKFEFVLRKRTQALARCKLTGRARSSAWFRWKFQCFSAVGVCNGQVSNFVFSSKILQSWETPQRVQLENGHPNPPNAATQRRFAAPPVAEALRVGTPLRGGKKPNALARRFAAWGRHLPVNKSAGEREYVSRKVGSRISWTP